MPAKLPEIRLVSCTRYPVESALAVWIQSRPTKYPEVFELLDGTDVVTAKTLKHFFDHGMLNKQKYLDTFEEIIATDLPVNESVHFTWGFANLPIEWREQAVRKRLWGFWLTSMREFSMADFADDGRYCPPPDGSVSPESIERFEEMLRDHHQADYIELMDKWGWPPEKARKVIPLSATHNGGMFATFRTLRDTLKSRSCWIAAIDQWGPWTISVTRDLRNEDPMLSHLVSPPCFDRGKTEFKGCPYALINKNRLSKNDPYAPCPLFMFHTSGLMGDPNTKDWEARMLEAGVEQKYVDDGLRLIHIWGKVWGRNPITGELQ